MATTNVAATLDGFFKRVYAKDGPLDLEPDNVKLYNMIPFQAGEKLGDSFRIPVVVKYEQGYTYGGNGATAFTLNDSVASETKDANVKGFESVLRSRLSYGVVTRSVTSEAAFKQATKHVVANLLRSFAKRLEISTLYGQKELGLVDSDGSNNFVVTAASWAPSIWLATEGAAIDIWSANLGTLRGTRTITAIDMVTRTITYDSTDLSLTAGDRVMFKGAYSSSDGWLEMKGLHAIMSAFADGSTDLFGINPQQYNVWRSTTYDVAGDLSFEKIQDGIGQAAGRGLDTDVTLLVSQKTWSKLLTDQAALRMFDQSYKKEVTENGSEAIVFYGQTGKVEIMAHGFIKEGLAMAFPKDALSYIGSTKITFALPGINNDKFFRELENSAGFELRSYADLSLFVDRPNTLLLFSGIVNS